MYFWGACGGNNNSYLFLSLGSGDPRENEIVEYIIFSLWNYVCCLLVPWLDSWLETPTSQWNLPKNFSLLILSPNLDSDGHSPCPLSFERQAWRKGRRTRENVVFPAEFAVLPPKESRGAKCTRKSRAWGRRAAWRAANNKTTSSALNHSENAEQWDYDIPLHRPTFHAWNRFEAD